MWGWLNYTMNSVVQNFLSSPVWIIIITAIVLNNNVLQAFHKISVIYAHKYYIIILYTIQYSGIVHYNIVQNHILSDTLTFFAPMSSLIALSATPTTTCKLSGWSILVCVKMPWSPFLLNAHERDLQRE